MAGKNSVQRATGAAAITTSLTVINPSELVCVKLHLSAAGGAAENFTITNDTTHVADVYDTVYFSQDMNTVTDILWVPDQPIPLNPGDVLDFAYNNANTRTYGLEIVHRRVGV